MKKKIFILLYAKTGFFFNEIVLKTYWFLSFLYVRTKKGMRIVSWYSDVFLGLYFVYFWRLSFPTSKISFHSFIKIIVICNNMLFNLRGKNQGKKRKFAIRDSSWKIQNGGWQWELFWISRRKSSLKIIPKKKFNENFKTCIVIFSQFSTTSNKSYYFFITHLIKNFLQNWNF